MMMSLVHDDEFSVTLGRYRNESTNYPPLQRAAGLWSVKIASSVRLIYVTSISVFSMSVRSKLAAYSVPGK